MGYRVRAARPLRTASCTLRIPLALGQLEPPVLCRPVGRIVAQVSNAIPRLRDISPSWSIGGAVYFPSSSARTSSISTPSYRV